MKRAFQIAGNILLVFLILLSIPFVVPGIFGITVYEVVTDSMTPEYPMGSVIFVKPAEPADIQEGDVITFSLGTDTKKVMTHRVVSVNAKEQSFITKGDANENNDVSPVFFQRLIGRPVLVIPHMGAVVELFETALGRIVLICLLGLVFLFWFAADHLEYEKKDGADAKTIKLRKKHGHRSHVMILLTGICLIVFAGYKLTVMTLNYHSSNKLYEELNNSYVNENNDMHNSGTDRNWSWPEVDIEALRKQNPDVAGWLYFEHEKISYPLMYSGDDDTYLHTAVDGSYAYAGSLFVEGENHPDFEDSHTIIYGHNMRNLSMFGRLRYYRKEDYYREHKYFQIITGQSAYRYQIFACEDVAEDSFVYQVPFGADQTFVDFIEKLYQNALYDTGVHVNQKDKIVTLSTCSQSGRRFVVHAVRVAEEKRG